MINDIPLPLLEGIYRGRGVSKAAEVQYSLGAMLSPSTLGGTGEAAFLLDEAVQAGAGILLVGDFDADGATSCALAVRALRAMGAENVGYLVPNRFEYGYGLTPEIVEKASHLQPDVIVTVDNGISSIDGVREAQSRGITVLVTDHHLPGEQLPTADVIVNPNLPGDTFPSKNLAGVGVIFYVMIALRASLRASGWFSTQNIPEPNMANYLDLVALGTVADCVSLDVNNRTMVSQGLERTRSGRCCAGIRALLKVAGREAATVVASDLGFAVGPRINAAGRMEDMSIGIECLLTDDDSHASALAETLDTINKERRTVEAGMKKQAVELADRLSLGADPPPVAYCLHDASWHQGVVGLVASRIREKTGRPVLALAPGEDEDWKGSARSVEDLHIRDVLARVDALRPGLITKFGGHAMAAGLSIEFSRLAELEVMFLQVVDEMTQGRDWTDPILSDGQLDTGEVSLELAEVLRDAGPWGQGFPEPLFDGIFEIVDSRIVGESHLKLKLRQDGDEKVHDAIMFRYLENGRDIPSSRVHVAYRLDVNEFRGRRSHQLMLEYLEEIV